MAKLAACVAAAFCLAGAGAAAQSVEQFYRDRQVKLIIVTEAGGDYDIWARAIGRHLGRHLPGNPSFVPQNMPGGGQLSGANHLYNVAARDGSVIGMVGRGIAEAALTHNPGVKYDPLKFRWIGSPELVNRVCVAMDSSPVTSGHDLLQRELIVGGAGSGTAVSTTPVLLRNLLGMRFTMVEGYGSSTSVVMAMERGEVQGNGGITWASLKATQAQWLREGKVRPILQYGLSKHPELPQTDWIYDWARTPDQRAAMNMVFARQEFGRPYVGPPGLSPAVVATLRKAFDATMNDAEFLADARRRAIDIEPIGGAEIESLVIEIFKTPPAVVARVKEIIGDKE
jgi:tripartite-type tricarboxylate transporter receptor subunit TctC